MIVHKKGRSQMEFLLEKCEIEETDSIVHLIETVYEQMAEKEWFAADNGEYTRETLISGQGRAYKAVETLSGRMAAVFMTSYPGLSSENLGLDIGLPKDQLNKVAHMDSAAVLPQYRGHGLQRRLMQMAEPDLINEGYRYLCCTVHPDNQYSLNSILSQGYRIMATREKYGGYLRHILMKEL